MIYREHINRLAGAFVVGLGYSCAAFFTSGLIPEVYHGAALICWGVHLWTICMALAAIRKSIAVQALTATGFSWGFLMGIVIAVSVQNGRVSANWPMFLPALGLVPLAAWLTGLPVYGVSRLIAWARRRRCDSGEDTHALPRP